MSAALTCAPRCSGDETEHDGDRERNRERDQRGASSVFHVPQQQTPQSQRPNPRLGCVLRRIRRAERPKEPLRSLDRVSSRPEFVGYSPQAASNRGSHQMVLVEAVIIVLSGMLLALVFA